ncbi:hypothetical protein TNCV_1425541 [Trichonephila clavipes]|nr:hypothetical protein TNCV_1425541 [Trichonephila clavipes]
MVAIGIVILELHQARGRSRGFLPMSKVAGAMTKDKTSRYLKGARVHRDVGILSTNRNRLFICVTGKRYNTEIMVSLRNTECFKSLKAGNPSIQVVFVKIVDILVIVESYVQFLVILKTHDKGSHVVKGTDLWLECHELEPCNAEDPPCREGRCTFSLSRLKLDTDVVVWKLRKEGTSSGVVLVT